MKRLLLIAVGVALVLPALSEAIPVPPTPKPACADICWNVGAGSTGCVHNNQTMTCSYYWAQY